MMDQDELEAFAEFLYKRAADQAQLEADNDVDRQTLVLNGLMEKPTYSPWWAIPETVKEMWRHMAVHLEQQAEVNDALLGSV